MSKGTRSLAPGRSLTGFALVLVLSGLILSVSACEELTSETSSTIGAVAATATTAVAAGPADTTGPTEAEEPTAAEEPTSPTSADDSDEGTTTSVVFSTPPVSYIMARWVRYQETDSHLAWEGEWSSAADPACSGGSIRAAHAAGAKVTIRFSGTGISIIGLKCNAAGRGSLTLDGGASVSVNYMEPGAHYQQTIWSSGTLASGAHVLVLAVSGGEINLDAVEVMGTLVD